MYQTKQKSYILNILKENKDKHLNAEEIFIILKCIQEQRFRM